MYICICVCMCVRICVCVCVCVCVCACACACYYICTLTCIYMYQSYFLSAVAQINTEYGNMAFNFCVPQSICFIQNTSGAYCYNRGGSNGQAKAGPLFLL